MTTLNIIDRQNGKDEWLTPPHIIEALGEFDLDPCSPINRPWPTARHHFTIQDNALLKDWFGRVWMNPPYGNQIKHWLNKLVMHGDGIALTFARTDTDTFHRYVFPVADSIFFFKDGHITFHHVDGSRAGNNSGAASVLIAYGERNSEAIAASGLPGVHLPLQRVHVVLVGIGETWRGIVRSVLIRLNDAAALDKIYEAVEDMAPAKVRANPHYKAKIRQTVQMHFKRVRLGVWSLK